jgi:hypothetical protein
MSTNLFPYKYLKGQWYQADETNDSDVVVVVDTSQETIWFHAGNKSTARNRSDARALLGDLMEKYTSYEFKRVSNETPDEILVKLDDLKELYYVRSFASLNYDLRKVSSIYFYLNNIGCLLLIISISFLGFLIFGSGTSFIDSHLHYSILFENFKFQISFISMLLIVSFSIFVTSTLMGIFLKKKQLFTKTLIAGILTFIPFFIINIWDLSLYYEIIGRFIYFRIDVLIWFSFCIEILQTLAMVIGFYTGIISFKKIYEKND